MGLLKQAVVMICGFILPRYFLLYYGSEVNGLISSMTHFLGFISLLELGIGPVIQANLYKPLAEKDIWITRFKRPLERAVLKRYKKKI